MTKLAADQVNENPAKNFDAIATAIADATLNEGDVLRIKDRADGIFDVVLASGVTPNTFNIVQCTGVATLALVLRVNGEVNILQIGADPSGTVDNKALLDFAALNYNAVYLPNAGGQVYGLSSPWEILTKQGFSVRADNPKRSSGQVLKALSVMDAVIQVLDGSATPGENIVTLLRAENISIDGDNKAAIGLACGLTGSTPTNQLVKMVETNSLSVARCRIGYQIGAGGVGVETDSAGYSNVNTVIEECTDYAVYIDTGNGAAIGFEGPTFNGNGFNPTTDSFNPSGDGANVKCIGGEVNLFGGTSAGADTTKPATADFVNASSDLRINGWWSDTHGIFVKDSGNSNASTYLAGVRHNEGGMTAGNTPISIQHTCKMTIVGSLLYGVIESNEGNSGSLTTVGINFVSGGAAGSNSTAYTGTLKTNQKGVISINNFGNRAQVAIGGGARDLAHLGAYTPQVLHVGAGSSPTGPTAVEQVLGPDAADSGYTATLDQSTGGKRMFINCYESDTSGNMAPIVVSKDAHIIDIGGGTFECYKIRRYKFADTTPVSKGTFQTVFTVLQGAADANLGEVVIVPPKLSADPTFSSGDYWEGGFYYNTTTNTLRVNTGASTWVNLN